MGAGKTNGLLLMYKTLVFFCYIWNLLANCCTKRSFNDPFASIFHTHICRLVAKAYNMRMIWVTLGPILNGHYHLLRSSTASWYWKLVVSKECTLSLPNQLL